MNDNSGRPDGAVHCTFDLTEATFLTARGHQARVNATTPHQAVFCFPLSPELTDSLRRYTSGEQQIDATTYQALRAALRKKAAIACAAVRGRSV